MRAKIKDKKEIAKDALQVDFEMINQELEFEPGQYFSITLIDMLYTDDRGCIRYFSICTPPSQKMGFSIVTMLSNSAYKRSLLRMGFGHEVELGSINGNMILPKDKSQQIVMIACGIGITPFMSMMRDLHEKVSDKHWLRNVTLFYSNNNEESAIFLPELKGYHKRVKNFKLHLIMTHQPDWKGYDRPVDHEMIKDHVLEYKQAYYLVAGPTSMVMNVANNFDKLGIKPEHYVLEGFVGY
ncbi:MAG: FAD-dependent oxidoreductase [bacterium]